MPFRFRLIMPALLSLVAVFSGLLVAASGQTDQERDRVVEKQSFLNEPVEITEIKTKKGLRKTGEKFKDADDWFKGLTVKIKNSSDKPVNYVNVLVTFARPQAQKDAGQIPFGEPLIYGISPADSKGSPSSATTPSIPPGESIELSLPEKYFDEYKALLKKLDFPDAIKCIELSLQEVGFEDGLLWSAGEFWRRDPHDPGKWIRQPKASGDGSPNFF